MVSYGHGNHSKRRPFSQLTWTKLESNTEGAKISACRLMTPLIASGSPRWEPHQITHLSALTERTARICKGVTEVRDKLTPQGSHLMFIRGDAEVGIMGVVGAMKDSDPNSQICAGHRSTNQTETAAVKTVGLVFHRVTLFLNSGREIWWPRPGRDGLRKACGTAGQNVKTFFSKDRFTFQFGRRAPETEGLKSKDAGMQLNPKMTICSSF
ncbi:uncharacterized protein P884DRAFT_316414 [Thermothelomyces heterothallicus CBS 202.75]|uniref:uncharacterized protein n=1 Tax=Thermothelomyces heterothallicus CBS 202.75 TaxID=1149848 RepID=UPI0037442D2F